MVRYEVRAVSQIFTRCKIKTSGRCFKHLKQKADNLSLSSIVCKAIFDNNLLVPNVKKDIPYEKLDLGLERRILIDKVGECVKYAKSIGELVKVYRFGFFRLQFVSSRLQEGYSLHVWSPELFDGKDEAPHNHNSFMRSRVLLGRITNYYWRLADPSPEGLWRSVETLCSDTVCEDLPSDELVDLELLEKKSYGPGQVEGDYYEIPHGSLHSSRFEPGTVTLIHKSDIDPHETITNILPHDKMHRIGGFDITSYPQDRAWAAIEEGVRQLKLSL